MRTPTRHSRFVAPVLGAALALITVAGPVAAGSAQQVDIVSHVTFNPNGPNVGDFVAMGDAADNGVICPSGTFIDTGIRFAGFQSGRGTVQLQVYKTFTCGDGSGTFDVKMQIHANFDTGIESFTWVVTGGTDAYRALRGSGTGSTVPNPPIGNVNTYVGFLLD